MKPHTREVTVEIIFQGHPIDVSLLIDVAIEEYYGVPHTSQVIYAFTSSFIDAPPRWYSPEETQAIVNLAQATFIRLEKGLI